MPFVFFWVGVFLIKVYFTYQMFILFENINEKTYLVESMSYILHIAKAAVCYFGKQNRNY